MAIGARPHLRVLATGQADAAKARVKCTRDPMAAGAHSGQPQSMLATSPADALTADAGPAPIDGRLGRPLGYRVAADGVAGVLAGVPHAGQPPRPLVLVIRDDDCVRFVSLRRVAAVLSDERRVLLRPEGDSS
jgi:hypothetical protein